MMTFLKDMLRVRRTKAQHLAEMDINRSLRSTIVELRTEIRVLRSLLRRHGIT